MRKKITVIALLLGVSSVLFAGNAKQPVVYVKNKDMSTKPLFSKTGDKKLNNYVFSDSKVEYANVVTIERLKKAVAILIDKVEYFEKELKAKEVKVKDLKKLQSKVETFCVNNTDKSLLPLKQYISENKRKLAEIMISRKEDMKQKMNNQKDVSSKYDKKIMKFLNNEK